MSGREGTVKDMYLMQAKRKVEWDDGRTTVVHLCELVESEAA